MHAEGEMGLRGAELGRMRGKGDGQLTRDCVAGIAETRAGA
jgi:hypothetical protein